MGAGRRRWRAAEAVLEQPLIGFSNQRRAGEPRLTGVGLLGVGGGSPPAALAAGPHSHARRVKAAPKARVGGGTCGRQTSGARRPARLAAFSVTTRKAYPYERNAAP